MYPHNNNVSFTPSSTVSNPYYSYAQNEISASLTGASSGSGTSSNTAHPTLTEPSTDISTELTCRFKVVIFI